jgi:UDP-glucose 4-epimerase
MRCLVTGGAGFIGSNLVHELVIQGHTVDVVDNLTSGNLDNLDGINRRHVLGEILHFYEDSAEGKRPPGQVLFVEANFQDAPILKRVQENKYDVVFHLAANPRVGFSVENPWLTTEENVLNTVALCGAIIHGGSRTRLVFSSTCAAYGNPRALPVHENDVRSPESPYGWQKGAIEDFLRMASKLYGLDSICLRYFNVYGPRQPGNSAYSTAISAWCDKIATDKPLRFDGDGNQTRDMVYVMDVVRANMMAAESKIKFLADVVNIGTGKETSNNQILDIFKQHFKHIKISYAPKRLGDIDNMCADVQRAKDLLGFESKTALEAGLAATFKWWNITGE